MTRKIEKIKDESNDFYSNDDLYNIDSWGSDLTFREIIMMYDDKELIKPDLQRNYIWDKVQASRFIESLLLGLPVPSVFLAKTDDEKNIIIDGYQRILTVHGYINGLFPGDNKKFTISSSEAINKRWRGKTFAELDPTYQRRIKSYPIHAIIFRQKEPKGDTSLYQIFERINTGGMTLNAQEIRNCIYQGRFNSLLSKLNEDITWRKLFGEKKSDRRMRDIEFILRFVALKSTNINEIKEVSISLKKFLNEFMGGRQKMKEGIEGVLNEDESDFKKVMNFLYDNFGEHVFNNISEKGEIINRFHPTIFDAISIATYRFLKKKNWKLISINNSREKRKNLLSDEKFKYYTTVRTTNLENIKGRIALAKDYLYVDL